MTSQSLTRTQTVTASRLFTRSNMVSIALGWCVSLLTFLNIEKQTLSFNIEARVDS